MKEKKTKKRTLNTLEKTTERVPLKPITLNRKAPLLHCPFRYQDCKKPESPFAIRVVSPSSYSSPESPSYALLFSIKNSTSPETPPKTTRPIIKTIYEDGSVTITTPDNDTRLYPRKVAETGSGTKVIVYSPTTTSDSLDSIEEDLITSKHTRRVLFSETPTDSLPDLDTDTSLSQEHTFQCNSINPNYSPTRSRSQKEVMGNITANEAVKDAFSPTLSSRPIAIKDCEWLHLIAHRFKAYKLYKQPTSFEPQSPENLAAASKYANTKMLVLEEATSFLLKHLPKTFTINLQSSCNLVPDSKNVMSGNILQQMSILCNKKSILTIKQSIRHDFGLNQSDTKQLAAMKDIYGLLAFIINRLTEKLGSNPLEKTSSLAIR